MLEQVDLVVVVHRIIIQLHRDLVLDVLQEINHHQHLNLVVVDLQNHIQQEKIQHQQKNLSILVKV